MYSCSTICLYLIAVTKTKNRYEIYRNVYKLYKHHHCFSGDVFKTGDAFPGAKQMHPASSSMMIVMENYAFKQDGVVTEFTMYVHNTNNITLQVWRRVGGLNSTDHALVGEYLYKPAYENVEQTVSLCNVLYIYI